MQVMFVDDESRVLSGIERALAIQDNAWECRFATSGAEALAMLEELSADVVVSDMRMPFMDGADLLHHIRNRWPGTMRIILTGYSDIDATLRVLDVAHQFVSKPCNNAVLLATVENALTLRGLFQDPGVVAIVSRTTRLPAAPKVFTEVCRLIADPASDTRHIAELLGSDPALGAKILQLANSAFFAGGARIHDIGHSIARLGLDQVKLLVLAAQVFTEPANDPYIDHLQRSALLASTVVARMAGRPGAAATAALLAHIGLIIPELRDTAPGTTTTHGNTPLHAAVAAYLLALWGLPMDIVDAVAHHHQPARAATPDFGIAGMVHVAVALANGEELDHAYLEGAGVLGQLAKWQQICTRTQEKCDD